MRRDPLIHAAVLAGLLAVTGCKGEPARPHTPAAPAGEPAHTLVTHDVFRVDLAPLAACTAGTSCEARLVLHALGGYKVNAEYPTKFVGDVAATASLEGPGTFAIEAAARGVMTVRFRADAAGTARVSGALKLSVCTDDVCKIEAPHVAFEVPVS
jgi:hypothetical protein